MVTSTTNASTKDQVTALARGLEVLAVFGENDTWLGSTEIVERTGLPKATVSRLTQSLTQLGYLHRGDSHRKFRLGKEVMAIGFAGSDDNHLGRIARSYFQELADAYHVHVSLSRIENNEVFVQESCHSGTTLLTLRIEAGSRLSLRSIPGLISCSQLPEEKWDSLLAQSPGSKQVHGELRKRIKNIRTEMEQQGFAVCCGDWEPGINGVGALISDLEGRFYSVCCMAPDVIASKTTLQRTIGGRLSDMITAINEQLVRESG